MLERRVLPDRIGIRIGLDINDISEAIGNSLVQAVGSAGCIRITQLCLFSRRSGLFSWAADRRAA
jgi:hypothetical protein